MYKKVMHSILRTLCLEFFHAEIESEGTFDTSLTKLGRIWHFREEVPP